MSGDEAQVDERGDNATTSLSSLPPKVLKQDDMFAVFDAAGNCGSRQPSVEGLYFKDTRFLSKWQFQLDGGRAPILLSSIHDDDGSALTASLANPSIGDLPKDLIGITRTKFLWSGACHERLSFRNYDVHPRRLRFDIVVAADFRDLFEVRGATRSVNRSESYCRKDGDSLIFRYNGLDNIARTTEVTFLPPPQTLSEGRASFAITLPPGGTTSVATRVRCSDAATAADDAGIIAAYRSKRRDAKRKTSGIATVISSNDVFNSLICRCTSDVYMLVSRTPQGFYPHAGVPWYSTVFGRDGILTALFMLWVDPAIAKGVLLHLAKTQAETRDPVSDAEPGKILHEQRRCEMANTGEVPFGHYYGTVDATPLFVLLAGEYWRRTGDDETLQCIWPNVKAALNWCETDGDRDRDGFVEYHRQTPEGLANQGWKDSHDSIFHADGSTAAGPIALVEVQAYVYQAYLLGARLAQHIGELDAARHYSSRANALKAAFHNAFWLKDYGTYALALDGEKRPCRVITSNAGHVLLSDLLPSHAARRVAQTVMGTGMWSGWGVRTLATDMPRYNPMSYHNGSIWPHDNAVVALGLARFGMKKEAARIFEGLYAAQSYQADRRLPELFCGSPRRRGRGPVSYPVSCSPQAWAAAAPFALISACLGLDIDHKANVLTLRQPSLPSMTNVLSLDSIRVGDGTIGVRLVQAHNGVAVDVTHRTGSAVVHTIE